MKAAVLNSPSSSSGKSSATTTTATMDDDSSESRESCYVPGCRRDTNCNCKICLASINATLDLMPSSIHRSSLTKISKPVPTTPVSFNSSFLSTPRSGNPRVMASPPLNSTGRMGFHEKIKRKKRDLGFGFSLMRFVVGLSLIFSAECGFSWVVSGILNPQFSPGIVRNVAEKSWVSQDINGRFEFLERKLQSLINDKVSSCSSYDSVWEINQDNLLLNSRCSLYKSATEEVSIWGWPLQTAGLLTAEFSSRSFTILSGRVTEWSDGKVCYSTRKANNSWVHQKWSASAVQLDPNTWILEYTQARVVENSRIVSAMLQFLKFRLSRAFRRMKQEFWILSAFGNQYSGFLEDNFKVPT